MFKYTIDGKEYKSKFNKDVSLFSINPDSLKILSKEHRQAFKGLSHAYKQVLLFNLASEYMDIKIEKLDGRSIYAKTLKYVSVNVLFEALKDNEQFKAELLTLLKEI